MNLITTTETIAFSFFLEGRIIHFLEYLYFRRGDLKYDQVFVDIFLNYVKNALIFDGLRICVSKVVDTRQVHLSMITAKAHHYMDSNDDMWFALTSGVFLPKNSRQKAVFTGRGIHEWWKDDPFPTLDELLSEWEDCGGVNGTDKVDMAEEGILSLTGFLVALEMYLVGAARDIEELISPVEENLTSFAGLVEDLRCIALA